MKKTSLFAALLASAFLASPASAATYQITFSGLLDNAFTGTFDPTFGVGSGIDVTEGLGKTYSLSFILDNDPARALASGVAPWDGVPGNEDHWWQFDQAGLYQVQLEVGGVTVLSGADFNKNELSTMNNLLVPASLPDLPPGVVGDQTYDGLFMETGVFLGCQGGACDWNDPNRVEEGLWIGVDHAWLDLNSIPNNDLPDLLNAAPTFATADYRQIYIEAGRWVPNSNDGDVVFSLNGSIDSVNIVPGPAYPVALSVPEPETYAMLLAGLGLLGWRMRGSR